jgi:transcriptional regulator with XRE-family HTH domain
MSTSPVRPAGTFSQWLRSCRDQRGFVLRDVAEKTGLDFTLLSRFETGERIPTEEQADTLAKFFRADKTEAHALRIAGQFRRKFADHPAARAAILRLAEEEGVYSVKLKGAR